MLSFVVGEELLAGGAGQRQRQPARHHLPSEIHIVRLVFYWRTICYFRRKPAMLDVMCYVRRNTNA